jgi:hypothetical protein
MYADERAESWLERWAELDFCFTPDEICRLIDLRRRYAELVRYREQGLDVRRLEFARWLARTGRLSEGMAATTELQAA